MTFRLFVARDNITYNFVCERKPGQLEVNPNAFDRLALSFVDRD